jgi:hypothetical protein
MENLPLLRQINKEIEDFKNKQVLLVPGLPYNQWDVLQRIYHYYNSRFSNAGGSALDPIDDDGDRMYFYNINRNPCKVFSKAVDFDSKNIRLLTVEGQDPTKTWFMERDLKYWMRDKQFGKVLNRLFKELPIFGTVVLKIVDGHPYFVDLRNFVVEQGADSLDDTNYKIEVHNLTAHRFRSIAKQMGWEQSLVDKTIAEFHKMRGVSHIRLYERYGVVAETNDDGDTKYPYKRVFLADVGVDEFDQRGELKAQHVGIELDSMEWDPEDDPYWEFHAEKIPGRWLGIGVVEALFEPQIRHNQLANLQSKASYWMALHVFQTRDPAFNRNLSADVKNGEVLNTESEVSEVVITDRNLAHFTDEFQKWITNRDELTFSYDVVQGERLPAGTPLGSAQIAQAQTLSYFEQVQEDIALTVKEMLYEDIIPQFIKENNKEHVLRLVGQDLDEFIAMNRNRMVNEEIVRLAVESAAGGKFPTEEDRSTVEAAVGEAISQGKEHLLKIDKDFYKNLKYDVDIDITGESVDTRVRQATVFAILQAITADPTMTTDPTKRKMLFWMAENGGVSPTDLFGTETKKVEDLAMMETGRAGGGVSAPALDAPVQGLSSQTI